MLFQLKHASESFYRTTNVTLPPKKWQFALERLGGIFVFSPLPRNHLNYVKKVLSLLQDTEVTLKLKKRTFLKEEIYYLTRVIRLQRRATATHTTDTDKERKHPNNTTSLRLFL